RRVNIYANSELTATSAAHAFDFFHHSRLHNVVFFFFNAAATTELYTLSLHDALPISGRSRWRARGAPASRARPAPPTARLAGAPDRKSTRLNSSHVAISYAVFCLKKKKYHKY